ncbi:YgfZ/GcvT domain-containing protein [Undibacterium sp. TJN19]|uniref:CAF17-like 4Fe-4S cluster assembly/insertion protein YgfZ n=1 Tax=Undibacterium sp. TJN19 TaxID=3413055 RepID=UPI003BF3BD1B
MNMAWEEFLATQGYALQDLRATGLAPHWQSDALQTGFVAPLTDLGLIQLTGEDAASFLHNQLSNDVEHLSAAEVRRAAYCTAKGRMLASLLYWKNEQGIVLQLSKTIQASVQKRLQMYVLRAKAKLLDINAENVILGLGGAATENGLQTWFPQLPTEPNTQVNNQFGHLLRLPDANHSPRFQWICNIETAQQAWPVLNKKLQALNTSAWRVTEIQAGIPQILLGTQEQFVPQMVNFELIGGVNFKKGCYPGQEIVARSQYLGKLKRRMTLALIDSSEVMAGNEIFNSNDPDQPCGMVVNAEADQIDRSLALIEMKLSDQETGELRLGSATGHKIQLLPLPYAITDITQ